MPHREKLDPAIETLNRVRRIETRLTSLLIASGIGTQAQQPEFLPGPTSGFATMKLPSHHCSLKEIMSAVPANWVGVVDLCVGVDFVSRLVIAG